MYCVFWLGFDSWCSLQVRVFSIGVINVILDQFHADVWPCGLKGEIILPSNRFKVNYVVEVE